MKKYIFVLIVLFLIFFSNGAYARTNVTQWYLKDFQSEIQVNKDSTLLITEKITADCGNAVGKHGIFRTLPTVFRTEVKTISMPVELIDITDFNGKSLQYSTQNDYSNKTVTWKIGDPDRTVTGENHYLITYKVKNSILFDNPDFDELYWNLNGNFWDLETDSFTGKIVFPAEVTKSNTQIDYYTGSLGAKNKSGATYSWISDNVLQFQSIGMLGIGEGITASVTFPKNIFTPYVPTFWEKYALYLWFIIPLATFSICFIFWEKYGKDPAMKKTIIAEFNAPEKLTPLELGTLFTNGNLKTEFITAAIVNLAVKKIIQIEEVEKTGFLAFGKDYKLIVIDKNKVTTLSNAEQTLFEGIFIGKNEIMLSELKNKFYQNIPAIKKVTLESLEEKKFIEKSGLTFQVIFVVAGFFMVILAIILAVNGYLLSLPAMLLTILVVFIFAILMPKRTQMGTEVFWKTQGFKLYMETAEKYRAEFYEKENIFEKLLPYAIMFGMTKLWIKKMKEIYGEEYFNSYHPAWFIGGNLASFDADSFASHISNLSSAMAANVSSGSGAGGGGGSGGGGGGGGGGGW
jgi:uncharacterized membrane protein